MSWPAPAKLNLFLHVTGRRADGYHQLQTAFQLVELCDSIDIDVDESGAIGRISDLAQVAAGDDLVVKAAHALQRRTDAARKGAMLRVHKRIPVGGGLGGGSSDAATVLVALNYLWETGLDLTQLASIGAELGADVPVFVLGHSAWGEGIGENLVPLELPEKWFVIVRPGVSVATSEIFQAPELTRNSPVITIRALFEPGTRNDCEPVARARHPEIGEALDWLSGRSGGARMTGTGSCVFASFDSAAEAERIAARVPDKWRSFVARGVNRSPLHEKLARLRGETA